MKGLAQRIGREHMIEMTVGQEERLQRKLPLAYHLLDLRRGIRRIDQEGLLALFVPNQVTVGLHHAQCHAKNGKFALAHGSTPLNVNDALALP